MTPLKTNPITEHRIGASGCDGTVIGFLKSRQTQFKYSGAREVDYSSITDAYEHLSTLAIETNSEQSKTALKELKEFIKVARQKLEGASKAVQEAELSMTTMIEVVEKVSERIDEACENRPPEGMITWR